MFNTAISFDDVLIVPKFSSIDSRQDVNVIEETILGYNFPVISSNMDTITEARMAQSMAQHFALGALHRFLPIEDYVNMFKECPKRTIVSIGLGEQEIMRATQLMNVGATNFLIDVANGASDQVAKQLNRLNYSGLFSHCNFIVGNFATAEQVKILLAKLDNPNMINMIKVGIGSGSLCSTRIVTGCGLPTLQSIIDCSTLGIPIIADGGIKNSGDVVKALAAGASMVMIGGMLAGTEETPGEVFYKTKLNEMVSPEVFLERSTNPDGSFRLIEDEYCKQFRYKKYRGSASLESYRVQDKEASWRSPEGESTYVLYKGSVKEVLQQIEGGLRSAMSYLNANTLAELRQNAEFVLVSSHGSVESKPFGKK